ncbi:diheme cytochrome c-553 [Fibrella sp. HMF5335]|uniref:Diheme cytochrome c-553 n=1 Tax=Fibrella rubiginis TaxID=2817060 RepID=A0A939GFN9_9BACT|nr:diheme cytochrome c-553 [Fibrella rubiginis]MBO0935856.1 diheme cytochrome c-553 [Fibrella rubiginis]
MKKTLLSLGVAAFGISLLTAFSLPQTKPVQSAKPTPPAYTRAQIEKGQYLINIMGCADCHAPKKFTAQGPVPDPALGLSGHPAQMPLGTINKDALKEWVLFNGMNTAAVGPWGVSYSANLTPHATGIGNWTEQQFIIALTEGKSKGIRTARPLLPPMPWPNYVNMKREDLVAMFAYLKSCKPIDNNVPQPITPDKL